jgi:hypothetical protein
MLAKACAQGGEEIRAFARRFGEEFLDLVRDAR